MLIVVIISTIVVMMIIIIIINEKENFSEHILNKCRHRKVFENVHCLSFLQ